MELLPWILVVLAALMLAFALVGWWWDRGGASRASRTRNAVAQAGEADAIELLDELGFEVLDRQATSEWSVWIDGEEVELRSRADLLVGRRGLRYVAEVKTGAVAPDPAHPATRRQLLEYWLAFPVDGVLLVDMADRRVREVRFPDRPSG
jgi:hypothetical protein